VSQALNHKLIELDSVSFTDGERRILSDLSFAIEQKQIVTVLGPNGSGKSTLIKLIANLRKPSAGSIYRKPGLKIGYVPQKLFIDHSMPLSVLRFVSLANPNTKQCDQALTCLNLDELRTRQLHDLSGGEFQRVLLARAIAHKPELLLLDEPLQGVDVNGQAELYELIANVRDELKCSIVLVSHDLHLVMAQTDHVLCLNHHICCHGHPDQISKHPEFIKLFGDKYAASVALYSHEHDHQHDLHGDVIHDEHNRC